MMIIDTTLGELEDWTGRFVVTYLSPLWTKPRRWIDDGRLFWESVIVISVKKSIRYEFRTDFESGTRTKMTLVMLPYVEIWVPLDVVLFSSSAVVFRMYMAVRGWSERRRRNHQKRKPPSPPPTWSPPRQTRGMYDGIVKATVINDSQYKDQGLQQTIDECKDVKRNLRKVEDPDIARKEKRASLKKKRYSSFGSGATPPRPSLSSSRSSSLSSTSSHSLAVSPETLQRARHFLGSKSSSMPPSMELEAKSRNGSTADLT
jgi:hypothetical protein